MPVISKIQLQRQLQYESKFAILYLNFKAQELSKFVSYTPKGKNKYIAVKPCTPWTDVPYFTEGR